MAGILHTKVHLYACGNFGTVSKLKQSCKYSNLINLANLRTYENSMCTSHAETVKVNLQLIGADDFGLNLKRICAPSSSNSANCKCAQIIVDFVRPNSPAYNCGQIQVGDRLLSINGHSTSTLSIDEILDIFDSSSSSLDLLIEFDVYGEIKYKKIIFVF
jgi:predicted metalloprotease with PDZ domain